MYIGHELFLKIPIRPNQIWFQKMPSSRYYLVPALSADCHTSTSRTPDYIDDHVRQCMVLTRQVRIYKKDASFDNLEEVDYV